MIIHFANGWPEAVLAFQIENGPSPACMLCEQNWLQKQQNFSLDGVLFGVKCKIKKRQLFYFEVERASNCYS